MMWRTVSGALVLAVVTGFIAWTVLAQPRQSSGSNPPPLQVSTVRVDGRTVQCLRDVSYGGLSCDWQASR